MWPTRPLAPTEDPRARAYGYHFNGTCKNGFGTGHFLNHYGVVNLSNQPTSESSGWSDLVTNRVTYAYGDIGEYDGSGKGGNHGLQINTLGHGLSYTGALPEPECTFIENYSIAKDLGVPDCVIDLEILADPLLLIFDYKRDSYTW